MGDMLFKVRTPLDGVENEQEVIAVLNELAGLGWDSNQWSESKADVEPKALRAMFSNYDEANEKEQNRMSRSYFDTLPDEYFIETFGKDKRGYLRSDFPTLLECAKDNLRKAKIKAACTQHKWAYTHSNGHKTCELCKTFADCSLEESLEHYQVGSNEIDDHKVLYFHQLRPLCDCGSHQVHYLNDSMFEETMYRCVSCLQFLPPRYDNTSYRSFCTMFTPIEDGYLTGEPAPTKKMNHNFHRLSQLGVSTIPFAQNQMNRYINQMVGHWLHVMGKSLTELDELNKWLEPYVSTCVKNSKIQIEKDDQRFDVLDVDSFTILLQGDSYQISFGLVLSTASVAKPTAEMILTDLVSAFSGIEDQEKEA